ncbi:MAG: tripartite tricarboxylate transporter permease [Candidatus Nanoarchaeia archaeon]
MLFEIVLWMILGIVAGCITGLVPGLHVNMIAALLLSLFLQYSLNIELVFIGVFIIALGITHTFVSFIPTLFLGVPTPDTVVSMLPSHQLVNEGRGYEALQLCAWGSLGGVMILGLIYTIAYFFILPFYEQFSEHIGKVLLIVLIYMILGEEELNAKFWAIIIVLLSGGFGLITLNSLYVQNPLFLIFTGMFGTATLLIALLQDTQFVMQDTSKTINFQPSYLIGIVLGSVSAMLCSISPGLGNAQAGTIAVSVLRRAKAEMMIVVLSTINTVNFGLSVLTLYVLDRARNGAIMVFQELELQITLEMMFIFFIVIIIVGLIAYDATLFLGKYVISFAEHVSTQKLNLIIASLLTLVVMLISNLSEVLTYFAATALGILCVQVGVRRVHLMAVLLVPIIVALW